VHYPNLAGPKPFPGEKGDAANRARSVSQLDLFAADPELKHVNKYKSKSLQDNKI